MAWNKLYRAEVWKLLHYPEGRLHEDDFVAHRLFWRCDKVVCVDKPLYHYRLRNGSICRTNIKPEAFDAVDGLADRYRFYVENRADRTVVDAAYAGLLAAVSVPLRKGTPGPDARAGQGHQQGAVPDAGLDQLPAQLPQHEDDRKAQRRPLGYDERTKFVPDQVRFARPLNLPGTAFLRESCGLGIPGPYTQLISVQNPLSKEPALALRNHDKEKRPRVLLIPPPDLPVPAVQGRCGGNPC